MLEVIVALIGLLGSAAGAIWAAYVGTRRRVLAELEGQYDAALRDLRLAAYPKLWAELEPLAKYAREPRGLPSRPDVENLAEELRSWYFRVGGLYLSAESREAYFQLQDALAAVIASGRELDAGTFEALRRIGSWLRTTLTYDVGTRRRFSLAPAWQEEDAAANERAVEADLRDKAETAELAQRLRAGSPR